MIPLDKYIAETIKKISLGIQQASDDCKELGVIVNPNISIGTSNDSYIPLDSSHLNIQRRVQTLEMEICVSAIQETDTNAKLGIGIYELGIGGKHSSTHKNIGENKVKFTIPICFPTTDIKSNN